VLELELLVELVEVDPPEFVLVLDPPELVSLDALELEPALDPPEFAPVLDPPELDPELDPLELEAEPGEPEVDPPDPPSVPARAPFDAEQPHAPARAAARRKGNPRPTSSFLDGARRGLHERMVLRRDGTAIRKAHLHSARSDLWLKVR
jgi:hypothetical protein